VSRTVSPETVAALRADGIVVIRQRSVAFIATDRQRQPFRMAPDDLATVADVPKMIELLTAVRWKRPALPPSAPPHPSDARSPVASRVEAIEQAMARGESAIEDDGAFHRDTAHASGNAQFVRSLEYLGRFITPRHAIRAESDRLSGQIANMRTFQAEHQRIDAAIQNRDPPRGRCAHICDRYRSLAEVSRKAPVLSPWDSIDND
jgi:GntR family transcriptional repressor for pyruvate dehydrogenase complex